MNLGRIGIMCSLTALLVACQFPQPRSPSIPTPPSAPSSAPPSSPTSSPPPSGSPSDPSSSPPSGESGSPPSSEGGPPGEEGAPTPSGEAGAETMEGGDVEGLDEQLDEALEDFDESVAGAGSESDEEAADILNPLSNSAASAATSDEPLFEEGSPGEAGESGENEAIAQRAAEGASGEAGESSPIEGEMASSGGQGEKQAADEDIIPIPDDVGDGRNDNIVERQIREAAMKERDAALREKLWDEYRRIKGQ